MRATGILPRACCTRSTYCSLRYAEPHEAPVTGSLADDLADIYCDLWRGRELWAQGQFGAAVWEWRFRFESHWGVHVTGALRAIRTLAAVHDLGFPGSDNVDA
jgi:hypothetical protein